MNSEYMRSLLPFLICRGRSLGCFARASDFPSISRFAQQPRQEYRAVFLKYRLPVLAVGALGLILVVCTGDQFVLHFYDRRYRDATWMVGILAIGLWHTTLYSTISPAIFALSKAHYNAAANLAYCLCLFTLIPAGISLFRHTGRSSGRGCRRSSRLLCHPLRGLSREKVGTLLQDALMTAAFIAMLVCALALRTALGFGQPFQGIHWH